MTDTQMLTLVEAKNAARLFVRDVIKRGLQWDVMTAQSYLPDGFRLVNAEDSEFHPPTVENITNAFRRGSRRIE